MFGIKYDYKGKITSSSETMHRWVYSDYPEAKFVPFAAFGIAYNVYLNLGKDEETQVATVYYEYCDDGITRGRDYWKGRE